jgi:hypothetical protein
MQELSMAVPQRNLLSNAGSALVGAVALSIVLFIASLGYVQLLASARNGGIEALRDDRAFMAAESGLQLATKWIEQQPQVPAADSTRLYNLSINEFSVAVDIIRISDSSADIKSTAVSGHMTYRKKLSWSVGPSSLPAGSFAIYIDNTFLFNGNTKGLRKMVWDGPMHFNTALQLGNPGGGNAMTFRGPVTVHNIDPSTNQPINDPANPIGHFGNDYRYGVQGGSGVWDSEFVNTYNGQAGVIAANLSTANRTDLTLSANDTGLTFGVSGNVPYYQFKNGSNQTTTVPYDSATPLKLHVVNKGVAVSGLVKGKVTVYTDTGKNIAIPNNLLYADFNASSFSISDTTTNHGYGMTSGNVIGLYTGGNFVFPAGAHAVTGLLFTVKSSTSSVLFLDDKKNATAVALFGSIAASGFWDSKQGNDQSAFFQLWDRRSLSAPGIGYYNVNEYGLPMLVTTAGSWQERNFKP